MPGAGDRFALLPAKRKIVMLGLVPSIHDFFGSGRLVGRQKSRGWSA